MAALSLDTTATDTDTKDPLKPKPLTAAPAAAPAAPTSNTLSLAPSTPLPTEYPSAPSTTGTPQNRLQLAQTAFDTFAKSTAPQYTADLRQATQMAAGKGQIGSGGLRTTYGNLANQRSLALDTARDNLINQAVTGTIADQQAAANTAIAQQNADTSRLGTTGSLSLQQAGLTGTLNGEQTLAAKQQEIQTKVALGQLTVEQGQLELAKLSQQTAAGQAQQGLDLQKQAEAAQEKYQAGQLSLADRDQALRELAQSQGNTLEQEKLTLAKDQLDQQGKQFGLSLAQQKDLAELADATQNRQLDISSAQGQNTLIVELARIMGTSTENIDPRFIDAVEKALGITLAPGTATTKPGTTATPGTAPAPNGSTTDQPAGPKQKQFTNSPYDSGL